MSILLDSNVWLPLVWNGHSHHQSAISWVSTQEEALCFCRVTHLALLRHLAHKSILGEEALSNAKAFALVEQLLESPSIRMAQEPAGTQMHLKSYGKTNTKRPQRWNDAYLAAFALAGNMRFATFDKGFKKFDGLDFELLC